MRKAGKKKQEKKYEGKETLTSNPRSTKQGTGISEFIYFAPLQGFAARGHESFYYLFFSSFLQSGQELKRAKIRRYSRRWVRESTIIKY